MIARQVSCLLEIAAREKAANEDNMSSTVTQIGMAPTASTSPSLAVTGLASGMDWSTVVSELADAERAPETQWKAQQTTLNNQNSAFTTIQGDLTTLQTDIETLQSSSLYTSRTAQSSDSSATGTAGSGTNIGTYSFNITQLATATTINGTSDVNSVLSPDGNLSNVTIGTAGFSTPVTAGTFTINGKQITIATTDSLQDVFNNISSATSGEVTASYDSTADKITLTDTLGHNLILGSAADTSNFLQAARLYNGSASATSITSSATLGSVQLTPSMQDADLKTTVRGDSSNNGSFTINGVTISYNTSSDSIQNVLSRINNSSAGVTASFDSQNNRFVFTNNSTGNVGISMQDMTGNFLAATGLSTGQTVSGQNLLYKLNGGTQQLTSLSNTITSDSSGISGLTVTATQATSFTVTVASDTSKISSAIQQFVTDYNAVQSYITSQQAVTNNSDGSVTAGLLTGDMTATGIASNLRTTGFSGISIPGSSNIISSLADLGVTTNGQNNSVTLDTSTLTSALSGNLNAVQSFFTDSTNGLCTQLMNYLNDTIGGPNIATPGSLTQHQMSLSTQSSDITTQINNLETKITSDTAKWNSEFTAMEEAQSQVNQELTYLTQQVSSGAL
jgi:flagellar hook-associated protein 2